MKLKVFKNQYTEGRLTLTEYHKKNMEVLKRIVYSHGAAPPSSFFPTAPSHSSVAAAEKEAKSAEKKPTRNVNPPPLSPIFERVSFALCN